MLNELGIKKTSSIPVVTTMRPGKRLIVLFVFQYHLLLERRVASISSDAAEKKHLRQSLLLEESIQLKVSSF